MQLRASKSCSARSSDHTSSVQCRFLCVESTTASFFFPAQGSFFMAKFPDDWPDNKKYDLTDWEKKRAIQLYPYPP